MAVAHNDEQLGRFLEAAGNVSKEHPVVISKFITNAKEIELDAVAKDGKIIAYAISEHVENAGVHSGDATLVTPPQRTYLETIRQIKKAAKQISAALEINGPFNMQFVAKNNEVRVIECNLRASRSFPFISKVYGINFIDLATQIIVGEPIEVVDKSFFELDYVGVKAPQFSFTRLQGADPTLGVEMASTGEVGCLGDDFSEALLKSMISVGYKLPVNSVLVSSGPIASKAELLDEISHLSTQGTKIYATEGTSQFLTESGVENELVHWPSDEERDDVLDLLKNQKVDLVINIPKSFQDREITRGYQVRRSTVDYNIPLITNAQLGKRFLEAIGHLQSKDLSITAWQEHISA